MKRKIYFIIFLFFISYSCEKEATDFQTSGVITGPDLSLCMCCGGYFIEIEDSVLRFDALPISSKIDLQNQTFPIEVMLNWKHDRTCGLISYIEITRIEIKNN